MQNDNPTPTPMPTPTQMPTSGLTPTPGQMPTTPKSSHGKLIVIIVAVAVAISLIATGVILAISSASKGENTNEKTSKKEESSEQKPKEEEPITDMPSLVDNQIVIGIGGKYFVTADTFGDTLRNANRSFTLYEYESGKRNNKDTIISNLEEYLAVKSRLTELERVDVYLDQQGSMAFPIFTLYAHAKPLNQLEGKEVLTTRDKRVPSIQIMCNYSNQSYIIDGETISCSGDMRGNMEKIFGKFEEIKEKYDSTPTYETTYKNHKISVKYFKDDNYLDMLYIHQIAE
jgi:hypothetical protein